MFSHPYRVVGVYGFSRRFAPNNPQSLLGGVLHNPLMVGGLSAFLFCYI